MYKIDYDNFKVKLKATNYYIPLLRSLIFAPMPFITFVSLKNMSLPEYTTLNMSARIVASFYAFLLLKEKINLYLIISLLLGSIGVLFVIQPGFDSFNPFFLLVIFSTFLITATTVIVNKYNQMACRSNRQDL